MRGCRSLDPSIFLHNGGSAATNKPTPAGDSPGICVQDMHAEGTASQRHQEVHARVSETALFVSERRAAQVRRVVPASKAHQALLLVFCSAGLVQGLHWSTWDDFGTEIHPEEILTAPGCRAALLK